MKHPRKSPSRRGAILLRINPNNPNNSKNNSNSTNNDCKINITPAQALVIGGILTGVFDIYSFLVDINQNVQITLLGSIKGKDPDDSNLNTILDSLGSVPLDDVLKAIIKRLS